MKDIKWINMPDWANVWIETGSADTSGWHKKQHDYVEDAWGRRHGIQAVAQKSTIYYPPINKTTPWKEGEWPPVGTVCEYAVGDSNVFYKCEIINSERRVIYCPALEDEDDNGLQFVTLKIRFRPIKTNKDKWIDSVHEHFNSKLGFIAPSEMQLESLYDAIVSGDVSIPK